MAPTGEFIYEIPQNALTTRGPRRCNGLGVAWFGLALCHLDERHGDPERVL